MTEQIKANLKTVAESVIAEFDKRKKNRGDLEKQWDEVDRQLRMEPELSHKQNASGRPIPAKAWMPETELPLQAQTLEALTSDARRLKFPKGKDSFSARAALTEEYIQRWQAAGSPIPGEKGNNTLILNQDNGDRLAQAAISHFRAQYDYRGNIDRIEAQAFSYGFGVGRIRRVKTQILGHSAKRDTNMVVPMVLARDARHVYLDDSQHAIMHEGHVLGPNIIEWKNVKYADLKSLDTDGWIPSEIAKLKPTDKGEVLLLEIEGDIVIETSDDVLVENNQIVTVAKGQNEAVVRVQTGEGFSTYLPHLYHHEFVSRAYGTSPLLKGMPVARAAAQAFNRVIESALLKTGPPIGYDPSDQTFASSGGPWIEPHAMWPTIDGLEVHTDIGGDPSTLFAIFTGLVQMYTDVTGVNPVRLGAQTKSHTTAFAKDVEVSQGSARTVDYVNTTLEGPMTRSLQLEYRMGLKNWKNQLIYVEPWNEFAEIKRGHLPDTVKFTAVGAGAPAEEQARFDKKIAAVQAALQVDNIAVQLGKESKVDHGEFINKILEEGGWTDVTEVTVEGEPGTASETDAALLTELPANVPLQ